MYGNSPVTTLMNNFSCIQMNKTLMTASLYTANGTYMKASVNQQRKLIYSLICCNGCSHAYHNTVYLIIFHSNAGIFFWLNLEVGKRCLSFSVWFSVVVWGSGGVLFSFIFPLQLVKLAETSMCLVIKTFSLCNCQIDWDNWMIMKNSLFPHFQRWHFLHNTAKYNKRVFLDAA